MKEQSDEAQTMLLATGGEHITNLSIRQGLRLNIVAGAMGLAWYAVAMGMPQQMFAEALGASGLVMGLLGSFPLITMLVQIPASFFVENFASRKPVWGAVSFAQRALWFLLPILTALLCRNPSAIAISLLVLVFFSASLGFTVAPAWYSWMADLVPERSRGSFWGARQSWTMAAYLLSVAISGYLLDTLPLSRDSGDYTAFIVVFTLAAIIGCMDILLHMRIPEPRPHRATDDGTGMLRRIADTMQSRDFRRLTAAMGLYTFSAGLCAMGAVFLKKDFSVSYTELSLLAMSSSVGMVVFGFIWGYVLDRIGGRALGGFLLITGPVAMAVWFFVRDASMSFCELMAGLGAAGRFVNALIDMLPNWLQIPLAARRLPQPVWLIMFANFIVGAFYGGIGVCHLSLLSSLVPRNRRTLAMAVHWSFVGLVGAAGPLLAGKTMDFFASHPLNYVFPTGTRLAFQHFLVVGHLLTMWLVVLPIFLKIRKGKDEPAIGTALSMLLSVNPIRLVTNVYLMGTATQSSRRARAIHRLGRKRASIAVSDLVGKLEDPSYEVREEAAQALGNIGTTEAVNALIGELDNPHSPLWACAARALGASKHPAGVQALVRHLGSADAQTRAECALALGEIRDKQAVRPLIGLIANDRDPRVITASAEALSLIGNPDSAGPMTRRMMSLSDPVLKKSIALAVGDLIGERDEFYQVLRHEKQLRGKAATVMISDLRGLAGGAAAKRNPLAAAALEEKLSGLQRMFDAGNGNECAILLRDIAGLVAGLKWNMAESEARARNPRFTTASQYAGILGSWWSESSTTDARDWVEILLGIYLLKTCSD